MAEFDPPILPGAQGGPGGLNIGGQPSMYPNPVALPPDFFGNGNGVIPSLNFGTPNYGAGNPFSNPLFGGYDFNGNQYGTPPYDGIPTAGIDTSGNRLGPSLARVGLSGLRGVGGGLNGIGLGLGLGAIRELFRNRSEPVQNLTAQQIAGMAQGQQGSPGLFANLFGGQPINAQNYQNYTTPYQHNNGGAAGTNAFERSGNGIYSDQAANRAQSAASVSLMDQVARTGFGSNFTGSTGDAGHTQFGTGQQARFRGQLNDGVLEHVATTFGRPQQSGGYGGSLADPRVIAALGGSFQGNGPNQSIIGMPPAFPFTISAPPVAALPPGYP